MPFPALAVGPIRADRLPEHGIAERPDAELGDAIQILEPGCVAGFLDLIAVAGADTRDGALKSAPQFQISIHRGGVRSWAG